MKARHDTLLTVLVVTYGRNLESEKIVFHDTVTTSHPAHRTVLRLLTPEEEIRECIERRQGGGEWVRELRNKGLLSGFGFWTSLQ